MTILPPYDRHAMPYLAACAGINAIAPVKYGAIQGARCLSEDVLIQGSSNLQAVLRHQAPSVGLRHGVIHALRVTRHEAREDLLRGWPILGRNHQPWLPLARPYEMSRGA